jgi:protein-S-isoprenylcysteine O-methyltransferase Ste14
MFVARNISVSRRLGQPIRGGNREAMLSVVYFVLFIACAILLSLYERPFGSLDLMAMTTALVTAIALLSVNLVVGAASLLGLGNSWRVGIPKGQKTDLVGGGIYRFSRNPYFLSYLIMCVAYTVLLQSVILLVLSLIAFALVHAMVLKEERHLTALHGDVYRQYQARVPRYIFL